MTGQWRRGLWRLFRLLELSGPFARLLLLLTAVDVWLASQSQSGTESDLLAEFGGGQELVHVHQFQFETRSYPARKEFAYHLCRLCILANHTDPKMLDWLCRTDTRQVEKVLQENVWLSRSGGGRRQWAARPSPLTGLGRCRHKNGWRHRDHAQEML